MPQLAFPDELYTVVADEVAVSGSCRVSIGRVCFVPCAGKVGVDIYLESLLLVWLDD